MYVVVMALFFFFLLFVVVVIKSTHCDFNDRGIALCLMQEQKLYETLERDGGILLHFCNKLYFIFITR